MFFSNLLRVHQDNKLWDSFQDPPVQQTSGSAASQEYLVVFIKGLKVFTYVFVFLVTLAAACFSKMSLLLMTSNIREGTKNRYCDARRKLIGFGRLSLSCFNDLNSQNPTSSLRRLSRRSNGLRGCGRLFFLLQYRRLGRSFERPGSASSKISHDLRGVSWQW